MSLKSRLGVFSPGLVIRSYLLSCFDSLYFISCLEMISLSGPIRIQAFYDIDLTR